MSRLVMRGWPYQKSVACATTLAAVCAREVQQPARGGTSGSGGSIGDMLCAALITLASRS